MTTVLNDDGEKIMAGTVLDAEGAAFMQRELEYIKARTYDVNYPDLPARSLFPVSNEAGPGVTSITYQTYDQVGSAKIINAYANDLPRADIHGKETTIPVRTVATSFGYNIDELEAGRLTGKPLDQRRASAARKAVEIEINKVAFNGSPADGLPGLLNNPNIPTGNVPNGAAGSTNWSNKTPAEILADVNDIFNEIFQNTSMVERGNRLIVPPAQWGILATTRVDAVSDMTLLTFIVKNNPYIGSESDVIPVNELTGAGTGGADIMVAYDASPEKLELEIPVELQFRPIQERGLEFIVPGTSRFAGLNIYYPMSLNIKEGI